MLDTFNVILLVAIFGGIFVLVGLGLLLDPKRHDAPDGPLVITGPLPPETPQPEDDEDDEDDLIAGLWLGRLIGRW